jgi:hypothetical protein
MPPSRARYHVGRPETPPSRPDRPPVMERLSGHHRTACLPDPRADRGRRRRLGLLFVHTLVTVVQGAAAVFPHGIAALVQAIG